MSNHNPKTTEVPAFDALSQQDAPFQGFGDPIHNSSQVEKIFRSAAAEARKKLHDGFNLKLENNCDIPNQLDMIIASMWKTGWNPETGNVNLFTFDFGTVLAAAILDLLGGKSIFRSETDMNHFSIYWIDAKLEAFPFHKILKCLYKQDGETVTSFVNGITSRLKVRQD